LDFTVSLEEMRGSWGYMDGVGELDATSGHAGCGDAAALDGLEEWRLFGLGFS
jgi:hypothetical protein